MNVTAALKHAETRLQAAGIDSPNAEAFQLVGHLLDLSRSDLLLNRERTLTLEEETTLHGWLTRRVNREPLQHILGVAHFYGLELTVTPEVLIPRPETERLVELALEVLKDTPRPRVLDVGTGSGAIALAIKHERSDAELLATDISPAALTVARGNAARLGLAVHFAQADLLDDLEVADFARGAALVVANPPYLPEADRERLSPEVKADPATALFSGAEGLAHFRRLERQAFDLLKPGAMLLVELDPRNSQAALALGSGWRRRRLAADLVGRKRFVQLTR